jgi:hypothetical protein
MHEMWYKKYLSHNDFILLESFKAKATPLLDHPSHRHFTDHTAAHSERIVNIIEKLLGDNSVTNLHKDELLVLLLAAYLHDLGMQIKKSDILAFPGLMELLSKSGMTTNDLETEASLLSFIRKWHHIFSYYMISDLQREYLGLDVYPYTVEIAIVAKGHRQVSLNSDEYHQRGVIRPYLLAAFLRLADELDCDRDRIDLGRMRILDLDNESKLFWLAHHCIDHVEIRNHYIKLFGRVPQGFLKEYKLLFIVPIWNKYMGVLDILQKEGFFLSWSLSEFVESDTMTRLFEKEPGLLDYMRNKAATPYDIFEIIKHLGSPDETTSIEAPLEVSPFYCSKISNFKGIRIARWPEKACSCLVRIVDDPNQIEGDNISSQTTLWTSGLIKRGQSDVKWPQLTSGREYGFLIIFFDTESAEFIYLTWKGKFSILNEKTREILKQLSENIRNDNWLSENEKLFTIGNLHARFGAYEQALEILMPLTGSDNVPRLEDTALVIFILKAIKTDMDMMGWTGESSRVGDRIYYFLRSCFSRNN